MGRHLTYHPPGGNVAAGLTTTGTEAQPMTPQMQLVLELVVIVLRIVAAGLAR